MSVDCCKMGGCKAYFKSKPTVYLSDNYIMTLNLYPAWASKVLNCLNTASKRTFVPGLDLSFDEGGIASWSKFCPVRQYNQSKPDKFQVEFFLLGNCTKQMYFIMHCDIYQGKNEMNVDIPRKIQHLTTTQKAVVNAVIKSGIVMDPEGQRCLFMDN